jgi:predicted nuclease of predicted toxin-antitoxin system
MPDESNKRRFLLDENLPKGLWKTMRAAGYSAARLIDEGLLGKPDSAIFRQVRLRATILTRDKDFLHAELFPTPHSGIIVVNLPNNAPVAVVVREVMNAVTELEVRLLANKTYIIEPGLVRLWS